MREIIARLLCCCNTCAYLFSRSAGSCARRPISAHSPRCDECAGPDGHAQLPADRERKGTHKIKQIGVSRSEVFVTGVYEPKVQHAYGRTYSAYSTDVCTVNACSIKEFLRASLAARPRAIVSGYKTASRGLQHTDHTDHTCFRGADSRGIMVEGSGLHRRPRAQGLAYQAPHPDTSIDLRHLRRRTAWSCKH